MNYIPGNSTGTLSFNPTGVTGTATITITVTDNGGTAAGGVATFSESFTVTVTAAAVNNPPTIDAIIDPVSNTNTFTIPVNSGLHSVNLSGLTDNDGGTQILTVTASSGNTALISNATISIANAHPGSGPTPSTDTLLFSSLLNQTGTATITVTVMDNGGVAGGGHDTTTATFMVVVTSNKPPTLTRLPTRRRYSKTTSQRRRSICPASATATAATQNLVSVTATSDNPTLVHNPTVTYTSPSATGSLAYTAQPNTSGTAHITVTVTDSGGTAAGGMNSFQRMFTVVVSGVNQPPTIDPLSDIFILENAGQQTINLTGISAGLGDTGQTVSIAISNNTNPTLIPSPVLTYTSGPTGTIVFTPAANVSGTATISVTLTDTGAGNNTTVVSFKVVVLAVNQAPTLNPINSPARSSRIRGQQTISLGGITDGIGDTGQTLTVTAASSNPALIPNPAVTYTSPNTTGTIDLHVGAQRHRHGRDHRHRDRQRRHGQRRRQQLQPDLHRHRHAGQPAADAQRHPQPRRHPREFRRPRISFSAASPPASARPQTRDDHRLEQQPGLDPQPRRSTTPAPTRWAR